MGFARAWRPPASATNHGHGGMLKIVESRGPQKLVTHRFAMNDDVGLRHQAVHWRNGLQGGAMLWTIFIILLVLWLLGLVTSYTMGGFIHVLLVIAVVVLVIQLVQGRRVV
jgi:predicted ferric reductase